MAITALLVAAPHYRPIFPSVDESGCSDSPGVRNLQIWMEAAWKDGESLLLREDESHAHVQTCTSRI